MWNKKINYMPASMEQYSEISGFKAFSRSHPNISVSNAVVLILCCGCGTGNPPPVIGTVSSIRIDLRPTPSLGVFEAQSVHVPSSELTEAISLIQPERPIGRAMEDTIDPVVAEVLVTHPDGQTDKIWVRWMGANPAAVSFDDKQYFWATDSPKHADGALGLIRVAMGLHDKAK
jgi:hypothetical protein